MEVFVLFGYKAKDYTCQHRTKTRCYTTQSCLGLTLFSSSWLQLLECLVCLVFYFYEND